MNTHIRILSIFLLFFSFSLISACGGGDSAPAQAEKPKFNKFTIIFDVEGTVTVTPSGTVCEKICSEIFAADTKVTIKSTAATGSKFSGFGGAADCSDGEITMSEVVNCSVIFTNIPSVTQFDLSVTLKGQGTGIVTSTPKGISCAPNCVKSKSRQAPLNYLQNQHPAVNLMVGVV